MVIERVAHTIKRAYAMVVSSVEGGGPKTRVGTAARGHGELRAEIARFAQIAEIDGMTAQVPTPPGDHHHPCPKVKIPIVARTQTAYPAATTPLLANPGKCGKNKRLHV